MYKWKLPASPKRCLDLHHQFYAALLPYRSSYLGPSSRKIYSDMFNSCSYPDKEWWVLPEMLVVGLLYLQTNTPECLCRTECHPVRRTLPVSGFIGMVETFSSYQQLKQKDPSEADHLSNRILTKWDITANAFHLPSHTLCPGFIHHYQKLLRCVCEYCRSPGL